MGERARVLAVLALLITACEAPASDTGAAGSDEAAAPAEARVPFQLTEAQQQGKIVYETVCWTCHGPAGRGDGPAVQSGSVAAPPSFQAGDYPRLSARQLESRFTSTGTDTGHPHMQYVRSLFQPETFSAALAYVPALAWPAEYPGSALAGREIYRDKCVACHATDGRGGGDAAGVLALPPADFTTDTLVTAGDHEGLFRRIKEGGAQVHGSSMPPWGILFTDDQIRDLVAYVASFQEGSFDAPNGS